jgi:uncharacterized protein YbaP (TraB family)
MNMHRLRRGRSALAIALALALVAASSPQASAAAFAWKATASQGGAIYLVGSLHLLTKDYYPLNPALEAAFKDADLVVEELDLAQMFAADAQVQMMTRGMFSADQSLETAISPATYALVTSRVAGLGLPLEAFTRLKPWFLALMLLGLEWQAAGFDPNLGLDKHFYDRAQAEGKRVEALETLEFQLSRFDQMTASEQDRMLAQTLKELDTQKASVTKLADAWKSGDAPTIERIVLQDLQSEPRLYQWLLVDRNRNWLPKLEALFARPRRAFVVVGAAHLVGPDGLLAMLRAKGYTIEQLK